jgi:glycosyltransferase involved in cell wall biosynthesis/ubiquinone/menaquinone biosynthesis C-methylase UbiE
MHDQFPFTGGCHYTDNCVKYIDDCADCPQLENDNLWLPALFLKEKKQYLGLERTNLSAIFPSRWLKDCALKSPIFKNKILEVIPNSIDTHLFTPMPQMEARRLLNLPADSFILLFVASDMNESRKGLDILNDSLRVGMEGPYQELFQSENFLLLMVGHSAYNDQQTPPVRHLKLNFTNDIEMLRQAYCGADLMAFCSREDNLPNTIIEAMSCGLPTIAYDIGGCGDIIKHLENGYLIPPRDYAFYVETMAKVATHRDSQSTMRSNCLKKVSLRFTPQIQANAYLKFFESVIAQKVTPDENTPIAFGQNIPAEILKRITSQKQIWKIPDRINKVEDWLNSAIFTDSIYYLTPPRDYHHEEAGYDAQYGISPDNVSYGNGLGNLLISRGCDFSAPALEIGCGTGLLTLGMCQKNLFPLFIASDASPAFMHIVKNKLQQTKNFNETIRLAVLDGDTLASAPEQSFSLIVLKATLHHITDPENFIKNISKLLVPKGLLVFQEPFREGHILLGLMAQSLMDKRYKTISRKFWKVLIKAHAIMPNRYTKKISDLASTHSKFAKLQLLIDTMKAATRRDIDKSTWEDKHLFRVSDITQWGRNANLDVEFIANRDFNEFSDDAIQNYFSYRKFVFAYLSKCMNFGDKFALDFESDLGNSFDYLDQVASNNNAPEFYGIFLYRKK